MPELDEIKRAIRESSELSRRGDNLCALSILDEALAAHSSGQGSSERIRTLARHASVVAEQLGDLRLVRKYREQVLSHNPDDPLALLSLAETLQQAGEQGLAASYARRSYQLSKDRGTELDRAVMESVAKGWPEIANE